MNVRLPDGRIVKDVPDGTTKSQLVQTLRRNGVIGPEMGAQMLGLPAQPDARAQADQAMGAPQRFVVGAGRGMMDVAEGLGQLGLQAADVIVPSQSVQQLATGQGGRADVFTQERQEDLDVFNRGNLGLAGGLGRLTGNVAAAALPGAAAGRVSGLTRMAGPGSSTMARAAANVAGGAAGGGTLFVPEGGSRGQNMLTGGALGGAMGLAAGTITRRLQSAGKRAARKLSRRRRLAVANKTLATTPGMTAAQRAHMAADIADGFTPEQALRKFEMEEIGATPTLGRVSGNLDDLRFEVDQARFTGPIADVEQATRRGVDEGMRRQVARAARGADVEAGAAGRGVRDALSEARDTAKASENRAWSAARDRAQELNRSVAPGELAGELADRVDDLGLNALAPIRSRLLRFGIIRSPGQGLPDELVPDVRLSPRRAEALRRAFTEVHDPSNPSVQQLGGRLKKAIIADMKRDFGEDVFGGAIRESAERFGAFDNRKIISALLDGKIGPEQLASRMQSASTKSNDVLELFQTLEKVNKPAANQLRAANLDAILSKARGAVDVDEVPRLTPATLNRRLQAIGQDKLKTILGAGPAQELQLFGKRLARYTATDFRTAGPGTAGDLLNKLRRGFGSLIDKLPGGQWIMGLVRAASDGAESRVMDAKVRRALNLEILKRENLMRELLTPANDAIPGVVSFAAGAAQPGVAAVSEQLGR